MEPSQQPEHHSASETKDVRKKMRRRAPRYLVGLRRVAYVIVAAVWGYAIYAATSKPFASFLEQFGGAIAATVAVAISYWLISIASNSSRHFFKHAARSLGAAAIGSRRSKWERTTRQLSWIAAGVAIWFVYDLINQHEQYSTKEVLAVMAIAAVGSFVAVRLISWVLRGFVRVK